MANEKKAEPSPSKKEQTAKTTSSPDAGATKPEGSTKSDAAPANYSRGEGQKVVTQAYRDNWNAIFGKKKTRKR